MFVYDHMGIQISLGLLVVAVLVYLFTPRPSFVVPRQLINQKKKRQYLSVLFLLLFLVCLLPSNLGWIKDKKVATEKVTNIQILFDVSLSMAATDIPPSRFHAARSSVITLIEELEDYHISLVAFAGKAFTYLPFSSHTQALAARFGETDLADFVPTQDFVGTAIGDAIFLGIKNLEDLTAEEDDLGLIILLTDGDNNAGNNDPQAAVDLAKKLKIPIFTLGIGEDNVVFGRDRIGKKVYAKIDIPLLKDIASGTNGSFYRVYTPEDFTDIFSEIRDLVKAQEIKRVHYSYTYINMYLLVAIFFLLCILLFMRKKT